MLSRNLQAAVDNLLVLGKNLVGPRRRGAGFGLLRRDFDLLMSAPQLRAEPVLWIRDHSLTVAARYWHIAFFRAATTGSGLWAHGKFHDFGSVSGGRNQERRQECRRCRLKSAPRRSAAVPVSPDGLRIVYMAGNIDFPEKSEYGRQRHFRATRGVNLSPCAFTHSQESSGLVPA